MYSAAQRSNLQRHMQAAHGQIAPLDTLQAAPVDPNQGNVMHQAQDHAGAMHHSQEHAAAMHQQQAVPIQQGQAGGDAQVLQAVAHEQAMQDAQAIQAGQDAEAHAQAAAEAAQHAASNSQMVMHSAG